LITTTKTKLNSRYRPLFSADSRYFIIIGGRGSGKSFAVSFFPTLLTFEAGHRILFTRQTMTSAHLSIIPEVEEKIDLLGAGGLFHSTKREVINRATDSAIIFRGIKSSSGDQTANLKSLKGVTTWIVDEAEELTDETKFDTIDLSVRQKGPQNRVILVLNPATKEHWIYKRFYEAAGVPDMFNGTVGDVTYIHTTYLDNRENLDRNYVKRLDEMKTTNPSKYQHRILGTWKDKADGVVFNNWKFGPFNPQGLPVIFGQDYGYNPDPTTLIEVAISVKKKRIWVKEHLYKTGLSTSQIGTINKEVAGNNLIVGDSAEPRLIAELESTHRNNIIESIKGQGSVNLGITQLLDFEIIVDPDSANVAKELNNFVYADKKTALTIDDYNHTIDPLRYVLTYYLGGRQTVEIR